jgi:hypothetical protein
VVFGLIAAFVLLLVGVALIVFATRIGGWISSSRMAYQREMKKIRGEECNSCVSSWNTTALRYGRAFDAWLIRIIGIAFIAGAVYLFFVTCSTNY